MNTSEITNIISDDCRPFEAIWNARNGISDTIFYSNIVINGILAIPTFVSNLILIIAIWSCNSMRTPSNIIICSLACSDIGVGLLAQPLAVAKTVIEAKASSSFDSFCSIHKRSRVSSVYFCVVSFVCFTAVSLDKYLMVLLHLRYHELVTTRRVIMFLLIVWALAALCILFELCCSSVITMVLFIGAIVCFIVTLTSYVWVYRTVRRHQKAIHDQLHAVATESRDKSLYMTRVRKNTMSMILVYVWFVICYLPFVVVTVVGAVWSGNESAIQSALLCTGTVIFLNSFVNPFLFYWRIKDFRVSMHIIDEEVKFVSVKTAPYVPVIPRPSSSDDKNITVFHRALQANSIC
ncbi:predicted protein [Nematostella vectensis]|uniref:G-protein coupled receptors family 1 profile domain-containing protein n=1 Tax=Nematostella vectensis TaxID=45351 RepID=A7SBC3_NEMVE|nr:predicted protein [Nematostella vectensis]|eukprot:XP_001631040.1 predicted protein [Nematostella vectensis]